MIYSKLYLNLLFIDDVHRVNWLIKTNIHMDIKQTQHHISVSTESAVCFGDGITTTTQKPSHFDLMEHLICDVSNFLYELQNTSNTLRMFSFALSFWFCLFSSFFQIWCQAINRSVSKCKLKSEEEIVFKSIQNWDEKIDVKKRKELGHV